ncbi:MAG: hypothetical protein LBN07_01745 [Christensenellaceae bacterium]|jgi:hypothetical protein|nr:hypothetical protein [Christensenellaceae bacterium]
MASNGIAGEFFVAAELTKRGMIATITGKNTKDIDVLAANPETGKTVLIQVKEKSLTNSSHQWKMTGEVKEKQIKMDIWYIFVDLADFKCYIISAKEMFPLLKKRQDDWNNGYSKRTGEKHKPDPHFFFDRTYDLLDSNGNPKCNNWEDLPIFK